MSRAARPAPPSPMAGAAPPAPPTAGAPRRPPARAAPPPVYPKRRGYLHGYLQEAAVKRGLEVIAARGPAALTLRGIARDLGVTPMAVAYHFGNLEGLRQAVADEIARRMSPHDRMNASPDDAPARIVQNGLRWVEFAAEHPNWYAFAASVAWRRRPRTRRGGSSWFGPALVCLQTTRRSVQGGWGGSPRHVVPSRPDLAERGAAAAAATLAGIHGLAMARAEGLVGPEHALPFLVALAVHAT